MPDEELKRKAKESYWNSDANGGLSSEKNYILGFIAGAKELEKENQQLKQQNEQLEKQIKDLESQLKYVIEDNDYYQKENKKMKCCGNCKYRRADEVVETCRKKKIYTLNKGCCEEWELAE